MARKKAVEPVQEPGIEEIQDQEILQDEPIFQDDPLPEILQENEGMVSVFIPKEGLETHTQEIIHDQNGVQRHDHVLTLEVNGEKLRVPCEQHVLIPERFLDAVSTVLSRQQAVRKESFRLAEASVGRQ